MGNSAKYPFVGFERGQKCDFGWQPIPLHNFEGKERVFIIVYSCVDLSIYQWVRVRREKPGLKLKIRLQVYGL